MAKHFIKISTHKKPANKLQEAVSKQLLQLDQSLHANLDKAINAVYESFRETLLTYEGRCTIDFPMGKYTTDDTYCVYISDMHIVAIHIIKKDLT